LKRRVFMSSSKFRRHIEREIQNFIQYAFRDINLRSPDAIVFGQLQDINKKSGGIIKARLSYRSRKVAISVSLPTN